MPLVPSAKIKKKKKEKKLPPAIFLPVMQYSWAGTRSLGEKLSSDRISDQVRSVGERYHCWTCVRSKEFQRVIGANHGGDDFCFRCMRTTIDFHRCGARWIGQTVKGTVSFLCARNEGKEREERNEGLASVFEGLFIESLRPSSSAKL